MTNRVRALLVLAASVVPLVLSPIADAALGFYVEPGGWPNAAHRQAAVDSIQSALNRYNAYGDFGNASIYVDYNVGVPTAQASHNGKITFGGTYPNERVTMHEVAHYLGLPFGNWYGWMGDGNWDGAIANQLVKQFDGDFAIMHGDQAHFWPYGLNYDSEGSEINRQRQVALVYAMRGDLGLGPTAHPSLFGGVVAAASDPLGESSFNLKSRWSDGYFPHTGADYRTGNQLIRTPDSFEPFTFGGRSLMINNTTRDRGLAYKGRGAGVITINDLMLRGGSIHNYTANLFRLAGNLNVLIDSTIYAQDGDIELLTGVTGGGALTIGPTGNENENNRYVRFLSGDNTFTGDIVNQSRFELVDGANFLFDIGPAGVNNAIAGSGARDTRLNGDFEFDFADATLNPGDAWQLVTAANTSYGATFDLPGFTNYQGLWKNGLYAFNQSTGLLSVAPVIDLDDDGVVDIEDYTLFLANHATDLSVYAPAEQAARGDFDGDGDNDYFDFRFFKQLFNELNGPGAFAALSNNAAPEPMSTTLLALASAGLLFSRKRR